MKQDLGIHLSGRRCLAGRTVGDRAERCLLEQALDYAHHRATFRDVLMMLGAT
jgi:hypothetical protein